MTSTVVKVGLVPLARTTFDIPLATDVAAQVRSCLAEAGFGLAGPESLVTDLKATQAAAQELVASSPDLLVVLQTTFADSTMVMHLVEAVDAPLLLWAVDHGASHRHRTASGTSGSGQFHPACGSGSGNAVYRRPRAHRPDVALSDWISRCPLDCRALHAPA